MLSTMKPTSTPHCTPVPPMPEPMNRRRAGPAVLPICEILGPSQPPKGQYCSACLKPARGNSLQLVMARLPLAAISPSADTMPATPAPHSAPTLGSTSQLDTAEDSQVAAEPTISANVPAFVLHAKVPMSFRGSGQVRIRDSMSMPVPPMESTVSTALNTQKACRKFWLSFSLYSPRFSSSFSLRATLSRASAFLASSANFSFWKNWPEDTELRSRKSGGSFPSFRCAA
mmetsp:Transcript_50962/g.121944  ORF Transcript_50962/g.121944 Transcript_50962/m.121944 type:complete len:229 (-) Transcript_50962:449-1135(-)